MKSPLLLFLIIQFSACTNHSDDGLYVGTISMPAHMYGPKPVLVTKAWIINGNLVTICEMGNYRQVELLRDPNNRLGMGSNIIGPNDGILSNTLGRIEYDSVGNKYIKMLFLDPFVLKKVSDDANVSPTEIIDKYKIIDYWAKK